MTRPRRADDRRLMVMPDVPMPAAPVDLAACAARTDALWQAYASQRGAA